jgi:hypothetical protein
MWMPSATAIPTPGPTRYQGRRHGHAALEHHHVAGGDQPIYNEDGTVTVVFNGELYNHHALRSYLGSGAHRVNNIGRAVSSVPSREIAVQQPT